MADIMLKFWQNYIHIDGLSSLSDFVKAHHNFCKSENIICVKKKIFLFVYEDD